MTRETSRGRQAECLLLDRKREIRTSVLGREREFATFGCGRSVAICPSHRLPPANDRCLQNSDLLNEFGERPVVSIGSNSHMKLVREHVYWLA